jgi:8-oxo-dGTP pyrophosphatase MutT (NUDIX family)
MAALINKACAVVLRHRAGTREVLVFRHPKAGMQLVKGTLEPDETPVRAAQRELFEEAGVPTESEGRVIGSDGSIAEGQIWHFVLCPVSELPEQWTFQCHDDGGHLFSFSWHGLDAEMDESEWDPVFIRAHGAVRRFLAASA